MIRNTFSQIKNLLKRKQSLLVFAVLMLITLYNFYNNVKSFRGFDVVDMYHPMRMLLLSWDRVLYSADAQLLLVLIFPLVMSVPAGLSYAEEHQNGTELLYISRLGKSRYLWTKLFAVFAATFIVFTVPGIIEIILNCISFPLNASGSFNNYGIYSSQLHTEISRYLFTGIYYKSVYLYAVVGTLFFGVLSAVMACFTYAVSLLADLKYRVLYMLPAFLLLELSGVFSSSGKTQWYRYAFMFNGFEKDMLFFTAAMGVIVLFTLVSVAVSARRTL